MIDPSIIVRTIELCVKLIQSLKSVDQNVHNLVSEVESLRKLLLSIQTTFEDPSLQHAISSSPAAKKHWEDTQGMLEEFTVCLEAFKRQVEDVTRKDSGIFRRPAQAMKLAINGGELDGFRQNLNRCQVGLNTSLILANMYHPLYELQKLTLPYSCFDLNLGNRLESKIDLGNRLEIDIVSKIDNLGNRLENDIMSKIDNLGNQLNDLQAGIRQFKAANQRMTKGSDGPKTDINSRYLQSAQHFCEKAIDEVSRLTECFSEVPDVDRRASIFLTPLTDPNPRVLDWLQEPDNSSNTSDSYVEHAIASEEETSAADYSPSHLDDDAIHEASDSDVEPDMIERWQKQGRRKLDESQYLQASSYLEKALERAEAIHGKTICFEGRDGLLDLLAKSYCHQGRFGEVEEILNKYSEDYDGKVNTLYMLLAAQCDMDQWEDAERLLLKYTNSQFRDRLISKLAEYCYEKSQFFIVYNILLSYGSFEGREKILKWLTTAFIEKGEFERAKTLLLEYLKNKAQDDPQSLDASHKLAELYLTTKEFDMAAKYGKKALDGRKKVFGKRNKQFIECIHLLIKIYITKGDMIEADGYIGLLEGTNYTWSNQEKDLYRLSMMENDVAAEAIGKEIFQDLFINDESFRKKWENLKHSIRRYGPFASNSGEFSLIHAAAEAGRESIVRYLIQKGVIIHHKDLYGRTPFFIAIERSHESVVRLLIENGANVNGREGPRTPLLVAILRGDTNVVQLLLEKGADVNSGFILNGKASTVLLEACNRNDIETVELLLQHRADTSARNSNGCTAFYTAATQGNIELARLLLRHGGDINAPSRGGHSPLTACIEGGSENIIGFLLESGASANSIAPDGKSALMKAAEYGREEVVRLLLHYRATVNKRSTGKRWTTPLWQAVYRNHIDVARILLAEGASVNELDPSGCTPLAFSAEKGFKDMATVLIHFKANVTLKCCNGAPVLYHAAKQGNPDIVRLLIQHGANVDCTCDYDGRTPLHVALISDHVAVVGVLLENEASKDIKDSSGLTPLSWAKKNANSTIVQLLSRSRSSNGIRRWTRSPK